MNIEEPNDPVWGLHDSHPAKRFLEAFTDCRSNCSGRELDFGGRKPVDQEWTSSVDGRKWTFSGFIYAVVCFDIVLDGFLDNAPHLTGSEIAAAAELPKLHVMMDECAAAARRDGNSEIVELTEQVREMLNLWEAYLGFRKDMVAKAGD